MQAAPSGGRASLASPRVTEFLLLATAVSCNFSIAAMQILLAAALLHGLAFADRRAEPRWRLPLAGLLLAYFLLSSFSALHAESGESLRRTASAAFKASAFLLAATLLGGEGPARRALLTLGLAGALAAAVGLSQAWRAGAELRPAGLIGHYYTYAGLLAMQAVLTLAWALRAGRRAERLGGGAAFLLMVAAILQTQTRSAALAVLCGTALVLGLLRPRLLLLLPLLAGLGWWLSPAHVSERIASAFDPKDETVNERYEMWSNGLAIWRDHPWLGVGPDEVRHHYESYRDPESPLAHVSFPGRIHNNLIQIAAERGLPALLLWLSFWVAWAWRALRARLHRRQEAPAVAAAAAGSIGALLAFHLMGIFECNASDAEVMTLAFMLAGMALGTEARTGEPVASSQP
jgi:putative inorganic carbon (HCO3(-)) transporter